MIVQAVLLVPLFLATWGKETYGIWLGMTAFLGLLHALTVGFQTYVGNEFNKEYHRDSEKAKWILGSGCKAVYALATIELTVLLSLAALGLLPTLIGVSNTETYEVTLSLILLMVCWVGWQSIGGIVVRMLLAKGEYAKNVYLGALFQFATIIVLLLAALGRASILVAAGLLCGATVVYVLFVLAYARRRMPEFYPFTQSGSGMAGMQMLRESVLLSASSFLEQFATGGIAILVASSMTATTVPLWSSTRVLSNLGLQVIGLVTNPLGPEMARLFAVREGKKLSQVMQGIWLVGSSVAAIGFIVVSPVIEQLFTIWTRNQLVFGPSVFCWLVASVSVYVFSRPYAGLLISINAAKEMLVASASKAATILCFSFLLSSEFGLAGIAASVFAGELVYGVTVRLMARLQMKSVLCVPSLNAETAAIGNTISTSLGVTQILFAPALTIFLMPVTLLTTAALVTVQWRMLDKAVQTRVSGVLSSKFAFGMRQG